MQGLPGNVYLTFEGRGLSSGHTRSFDVLAGDNPPTITGGYANWQIVARPMQRGLTIPSGYDPIQMTVEVRFGRWTAQGGWLTDDAHAKPTRRYNGSGNTEDDIATLEWMAGSNFISGPSPVVYVWSHSSSGGDTALVPPQYSKPAPSGFPWIITGLTWGKAIRNPNGYRTWQDATVVLSNYLNFGAPPAPDTNLQGGYFVSKPGRDTALTIAAAPSSRSPLVDHRVLAKRILSDPKNNPCKGTRINLQRRSVSWTISHGTNVWVPQHTGL